MTPSAFIDPPPPAVAEQLRAVRPPGETIHIQVAADMTEDLTFGERWLVLTSQRALLLSPHGGDDTVDLPLPDIAQVRLEHFVGGGRLMLERRGGTPAFLYFSSSLAPKFTEVVDGIRQLSRGERPALPTELGRNRCPRCRRLLPEKDGICPACARKWKTLRRVAGYLRPYWVGAGLLVPVLATGAVVTLLPPIVTQHIIDDALIPQADLECLAGLVLGLVGVLLLGWACEIGQRWLSAWLGSRITADIRSELFRHLQRLPLMFYNRWQVGMLMSRASHDADRLEEFLVQGIPFIFVYGLMIVGILGLLCSRSWVLTLSALLPVPLTLLGTLLLWSRLIRDCGRVSAQWSRLYILLNESISGIRVVKAFSQERHERVRFDGRNEELLRLGVARERRWMTFYSLVQFLMSLGVLLVWYTGGRQVLGAELTLGELVAFTTYLWILYWPLLMFWTLPGSMAQALAGAGRIFEVLDAVPEPYQDPAARPLPRVEGRVSFRGVTFGYDKSKPVLRDFDLEVAPGERIGLVGRSGVGKTTAVSLIGRFYDVDRGAIEIDGVDVRAVRLEDLRRQIGLVPQEPFLFSGTIAENIRYGRPEASLAEVIRAARAANAHGFILARPDGYDSEVGERGGQLSGGERQRIAIARAILHDPRILILDEATSAVDTQAERLIQEAIGRLTWGRTAFIIAHRLSTLKGVDRIVVLEEGRVAEVGTHEELRARRGFFANLVAAQQELSSVVDVHDGAMVPM